MSHTTITPAPAPSFSALAPATILTIAHYLRADAPRYHLLPSDGTHCNCHLLPEDEYAPRENVDPALELSEVEKRLRVMLFENAERIYSARELDWDYKFTLRQRQVLLTSITVRESECPKRVSPWQMVHLFPHAERAHIHWGYDWKYYTKWRAPPADMTFPSIKTLDVVVRQMNGLWMTDLHTLARQFPCPELKELSWRCPIKHETGQGQLGMLVDNMKIEIGEMGWGKVEKVALVVEIDVFRLERGGDMITGFKDFAAALHRRTLRPSQITALRLGINRTLKPSPEMTDEVLRLRGGTRQLRGSLVPSEQALKQLFNEVKSTHPQLETLVFVNADIDYVAEDVKLLDFHITNSLSSATYTFSPTAQRALLDKLQAKIAASPAKWEDLMYLVEDLREADEQLEASQVMRGMRIPVDMLGSLSDDFLRNCGGFEIDTSSWGRNRGGEDDDEEGSDDEDEEEEEWLSDEESYDEEDDVSH